MADTRMKALISIARILLSLAVGYVIYYFWVTYRATIDEPVYIAIGAGLVSAVMVFLLLSKLKGGGD